MQFKAELFTQTFIQLIIQQTIPNQYKEMKSQKLF